jgi:hypothetical protein
LLRGTTDFSLTFLFLGVKSHNPRIAFQCGAEKRMRLIAAGLAVIIAALAVALVDAYSERRGIPVGRALTPDWFSR